MTKTFWLAADAALLVAGSAAAQAAPQAATESDVAAFRRLRAEGVAAINGGDLATAQARLDEADRRIPNHPGLVVLKARLAAAAENNAAAVALLDRYASFGLTLDVAADPMFERVIIEDGYAPVSRQLAHNAAPAGRATRLGQIDGPFLAEAVAWDERRGRYLISGVHGRGIVDVDASGTRLKPYLKPSDQVDAVLGLGVDAERGILWAATSGLPQAASLPPAHKGRAGLLKIDLASGRILARIDAPAAADRSFGDLAVAPDGTVYVSDSVTGEIFRLPAGSAALEPLVAAGALASPQGIVLSPDGRRLVVADYSQGLMGVDLATGAVSRLPVPANASLLGVDGMTRDGDVIIAVQNGVSPHRVVRIRMNADFSAVEGWSVLAANLPDIEEPTSGVVREREFVFVGRSQWTEFKPDGTLARDQPGPAVILRLTLP